MSIKKYSLIRLITIFALVTVIGAVTYAFAAANTVPDSYAGDDTATISGFVISNIHYNLNTTTPAGDITSVTFDLAPAVPAGGAVYAQFNVGAAIACTLDGAGDTATCVAPTGATPLAITSLRVVAAQ